MIFTHYDKDFKRKGISMDAQTSMIIRAFIMLVIILFPFYPLIWIYFHRMPEWKTAKLWERALVNITLFIWVLVLIGCIEAGLGYKDPNFWA